MSESFAALFEESLKRAEMRTGEGKTLMATLPVYLNALAGRGDDRSPFFLRGHQIAGQRHAQTGIEKTRRVFRPLEIAEHPEQAVGSPP